MNRVGLINLCHSRVCNAVTFPFSKQVDLSWTSFAETNIADQHMWLWASPIFPSCTLVCLLVCLCLLLLLLLLLPLQILLLLLLLHNGMSPMYCVLSSCLSSGQSSCYKCLLPSLDQLSHHWISFCLQTLIISPTSI